MCDLKIIGTPSIRKLILRDASLARMCPTIDLSCEENTCDGNGTWCRITVSVMKDEELKLEEIEVSHTRWIKKV